MQMLLVAGLIVASVLLPSRASAALGGNVATVQADEQAMKAKRAISTGEKYSVHEITTPYGTVVREYVSPGGTVFGVTWRGPFLPNLQQLLGNYYGEFAQAAKEARQSEPRRTRTPSLSVAQPDLVVHSAGHMRSYAGNAYVPGLLPSGVEPQDIR